ncbi:MAG: hypothetical protein V4674_02825 [Patescibacteria group bacterium]
MISLLFAIPLYFYHHLGTIGGREKYEGFWASVYALASFVLIASKPSHFLLFRMVSVYRGGLTTTSLSTEELLNESIHYISASPIQAMTVSIVLGFIFYGTTHFSRRFHGVACYGVYVAGIIVANLLCYLTLV